MAENTPQIRPAAQADAPSLVGLIRKIWPYEAPDSEHAMRVISLPDHWVGLAWVNAPEPTLTGFISCFSVPLADAGHRWQIDLLAVAAGWRGQGIGRRLIQTALETGRQRGTRWSQALIEEHNSASRQAFAGAGFQPETYPGRLLTRVLRGRSWPPFCFSFRPVPVTTLTYQGIWLESGDWVPLEAPQGPLSVLLADGVEAKKTRSEAAAAGFSEIGRYRIWKTEF